MVTYPVWPSRTFTRCKGHSSDLDKSSFRSNASLDADGNLRRRSVRTGEKISPVCGVGLESAPGIVSAMIVSGHNCAINPFRLRTLPFSSAQGAETANTGTVGSSATAHPSVSYDNIDAMSGLRIREYYRAPGGQRIPIVIRSQSTTPSTLRPYSGSHPRILFNHQTFRSRLQILR